MKLINMNSRHLIFNNIYIGKDDEQVLYLKSNIYDAVDNAPAILIHPSTDTTFNYITMQLANLADSFQNYPTAIAQLTNNEDGTYTISEWKYLAEGGAGLTKVTTGRSIDEYEVFDVTATYNESYILNSWNHIFSANNYYLISMADAYVDVMLGSGSTKILTGLESWAIYSKKTDINVTESSTIKLYSNIS